LASVRKGYTRNDLLKKGKLRSGGTLTKVLNELEESGFIEKYLPYRAIKKDSVYRLTDEYSKFYIRFVEKTKPSSHGVWDKLHSKQSFKIWSGFTFETICMKHFEQLKEGLKIRGVNSVSGSWLSKDPQNNVQIDFLIDRDDNIINLCEMKFYNTDYAIDKRYANELAKKVHLFTTKTKTRKSVFVTFITTYGLIPNKYSKQIVQNELTVDSLFVEL